MPRVEYACDDDKRDLLQAACYSQAEAHFLPLIVNRINSVTKPEEGPQANLMYQLDK